MAHGTQQAIGSVIGKSMSRLRFFSLGSVRRICFVIKRHQVSGMTHGDDFELTGPIEPLTEVGTQIDRSELISYGSTESINALNRRLHWGKRGLCISIMPNMWKICRFSGQRCGHACLNTVTGISASDFGKLWESIR